MTLRLLYAAIAFELFLGGGGRLIEVGGGTLRMVLFAVALFASLLLMLMRSWHADMRLASALVAGFLLVHIPPVLHGLMLGRDVSAIATDVQPLLYWLIAPFFAQMLARRTNVELTAALARFAGLVLALGYIGAIAALLLGRIDYADMYALLDGTEEFSFRSESAFFYKGFLYLCISVIFWLASRSRLGPLAAALAAAAVVLTFTRGFIIATSVAALLLLLTIRDVKPSSAIAVIALGSVSFLIFGPGLEFSNADQRDYSDSVRLEDMAFIAGDLDAPALLFGNGFGSPISGRLNIENSYLWILWKAGAVGVAFWLLPLLLCARAFYRIPKRSNDYRVACAFFFSVILIYIQTATNPYLNNPIGLSFVIMALFSLRRLTRQPQPTMPLAVRSTVRRGAPLSRRVVT